MEELAGSATLPGPNGEIGILPGHQKYAGLLEEGVLSYYSEDSHQTQKMLVSKGVCCFGENVLSILCSQVERADTLDSAPHDSERQKLLQIISEGHCEDAERVEAAKKLRRLADIDKILDR